MPEKQPLPWLYSYREDTQSTRLGQPRAPLAALSGLRYASIMNDTPLNLTIVYEPGDDGWITVSIPEVPGVLSQGRTRKEAREMILSALNDWLRFYVDDQSANRLREIAPDADTEPVHLSFAA